MMVVVFIIALLATVMVMQFSYARAKGRDAQRISDLTRFVSALENYYADNAATGYLSGTFSAVTSALLAGKYLDTGITNPYPNSNFNANSYNYLRSDANNYRAYFVVEIQNNASCLACNGLGDIYLIKNGQKATSW